MSEPSEPAIGPEQGVSTSFLLFKAVPSYLVSFITHLVVVIVMALITVSQAANVLPTQLIAASQEVETFDDIEIATALPLQPDSSQRQAEAMPPVAVLDAVDTPIDSFLLQDVADPAPIDVQYTDFAERTAPKPDLIREFGATGATGYDARNPAKRSNFVGNGEASPASEKAVALALTWLAAHQQADGSFNFDHGRAPQCGGKCGDRGQVSDCTTGATGLALLPFLGAGQTHREGKYRQVVEKGLYYLLGRMKVQNDTGSFAEGGGNLYAHGICAIVLCEAYAMTHDKTLAQPAQAALNYTMFAQDPLGGGWRYTAKQPGDTSAVGWQLMALKSGHLAYLRVNPATILGASRFLDAVQSDSGAQYGYTSPGGSASTTSVGLLSRMYLGWKQDHPALQRGVAFLNETGPSANNFYYNYYATQVMRHHGGERWKHWNEKLRDQLVQSQSQTGHSKGSWFVKGSDHGADAGGRLYCTAMATMILEVYYRHMPLYGQEAADVEFPL